MRLFQFAAAPMFLAAALWAVPANAQAEGIEVVMNQAKIVKVARPIDTIVIGNSAIVDASVQDSQTIVLTGKGFGRTNVVVLDQQGSPIVDQQVTVSRQEAGSIRVYRRAQVQTLSCTPFCEGAYKNDAERQSESEISSQ
ncbi:pilus assembly protein N-terminal domain-containing protein [Tianweitania sediminis]|uniref:Pilus assembly protein N-terminal domain-containing protein n=1 Tax=Tianweitania sediminis TaxID=1502156 RepID=A0A8J7RLF8_9HYPH|nr:pilus assembly protein N-terminal domain-containing protein [Tianweitania sediminis]MBP0440561.1 pilus assembly protein N-terminal domain-containing protein [Tianweitania sediminis]